MVSTYRAFAAGISAVITFAEGEAPTKAAIAGAIAVVKETQMHGAGPARAGFASAELADAGPAPQVAAHRAAGGRRQLHPDCGAVIGDVHGCLAELEALLAMLPPRSAGCDRIVFVGDVIAKGPRPLEVLRRVMSMPRTELVMGNHERSLLVYLDEFQRGNRPEQWFLRSYADYA